MTKLDAHARERHSNPKISGYEIVQALGQTAGSSLYRIRHAPDDGLALLKRLDPKSDPVRVARFRMEHELLASLHVPGIPRPLALISDGPEPAMVIEDSAGD